MGTATKVVGHHEEQWFSSYCKNRLLLHIPGAVPANYTTGRVERWMSPPPAGFEVSHYWNWSLATWRNVYHAELRWTMSFSWLLLFANYYLHTGQLFAPASIITQFFPFYWQFFIYGVLFLCVCPRSIFLFVLLCFSTFCSHIHAHFMSLHLPA